MLQLNTKRIHCTQKECMFTADPISSQYLFCYRKQNSMKSVLGSKLLVPAMLLISFAVNLLHFDFDIDYLCPCCCCFSLDFLGRGMQLILTCSKFSINFVV